MSSTAALRTEAPPAARGAPGAGPAAVAIGWAVGVVSFAYLMSLPPTLNMADESVVLYGAKRVYMGEAAYRDFFEFVAPGAFYLYALAYKIGGVSITSARVTTALLNALTAVCIYFLALRIAAVGEAVIAGLMVVAICVPVWNMASHHWIATTMAAAAAAVLLAPGWQASTRARPTAAGFLAGILACTHQGRAVWLIAWLIVSVPLVTQTAAPGRWRRCARELAWIAVGGAAICLPVFGYALWRSSFAEMHYAMVTWVTINYWAYNVGVAAWAAAPFPTMRTITWVRLLEAIPALLAVEALWVLWTLARRGLGAVRLRLSLLLLALSAIAAIMYYPGIGHVAFITPFALVVFAGMVYRLRRVVPLHTRVGRAGVGLAWAAMLALVCGKLWTNREIVRMHTPIRFESAFGTLAGHPRQANLIAGLRANLPVSDDAPARLFAYPGDAWVYLALPADNPTPFALLRPIYNTPEQNQSAIDLIERDPTIAVLVNTMFARNQDPMLTYLNRRFGQPILLPAMPWILYKRPTPVPPS
ncbi:MAG: hypothetical protein ACRERC_07515 [Candidatus Binatia bacterium]